MFITMSVIESAQPAAQLSSHAELDCHSPTVELRLGSVVVLTRRHNSTRRLLMRFYFCHHEAAFVPSSSFLINIYDNIPNI